jgi:hypothetical protein
MNVNTDGLAKVVATVLWADEKVTEEEWSAAEGIFSKYGVSWDDAKKEVEKHIEDLLDPGEEDEEFEETDEEFDIGNVYLGEVDDFEVLCDLAVLIVADKEVTFTEIDILHRIAEAINSQAELTTAALIKAVTENNSKFKFD